MTRFLLNGGLVLLLSSFSAWLADRPEIIVEDYLGRGIWILFLAGLCWAIGRVGQ